MKRQGVLEKTLFGFERTEVERAIRDRDDAYDAFAVQPNGDFLFFRTRPNYHEHEMSAIRPMRCVRHKASEGEYSCMVSEIIDKDVAVSPSFCLPRIPVIRLYKSTPQANLRLPELLNTSGWFDWVFPRDWSGYDLLRVDVLLDRPGADRLMLEVEDDLIEPPVSITYKAPPMGKWVTLEMDLAQAARRRGLDIRRMNNIWVRLALKDPEKRALELHQLRENIEELEKRRFVAFVDNIRLARRGAPCALPLLKGTRSVYTRILPRVYAAEEHFTTDGLEVQRSYLPTVVPAKAVLPGRVHRPARAGATPDLSLCTIPIADMLVKGCLLNEPENRQIHSNIRLTCTAAADPSRIVVGFDIYGAGSLRAGPKSDRVVGNNVAAAVSTVDGGRTWTGLCGTDWPSVLGGNQTKMPPRLVDLGGDVMAVSRFGCLAIRGAHVGYPADRVFFCRSIQKGTGWAASPNYFVSGEPRHCHWIQWGDVVGDLSGRIWTAWEAIDRYSYEGAFSYSVFVYCSDDGGVSWRSWRGVGRTGAVPGFGSSKTDKRYVRLAPYRNGIAVFAGHYWTWFDGRRWTRLDRNDVIPWEAVSCGEEIYIGDSSGPVRWYRGEICEGESWHDLRIPGRRGTRGRLAVCGGKTVVLVEPDATGKKLLCWRKKAGGSWQGPQELVREETQIIQLAAQRYAPDDFVPVGYMCISPEEEGKIVGSPRSKTTPGNQHYKGNPYMQLYWTYPVDHYVHEPWIKVVKVPAE